MCPWMSLVFGTQSNVCWREVNVSHVGCEWLHIWSTNRKGGLTFLVKKRMTVRFFTNFSRNSFHFIPSAEAVQFKWFVKQPVQPHWLNLVRRYIIYYIYTLFYEHCHHSPVSLRQRVAISSGWAMNVLNVQSLVTRHFILCHNTAVWFSYLSEMKRVKGAWKVERWWALTVWKHAWVLKSEPKHAKTTGLVL